MFGGSSKVHSRLSNSVFHFKFETKEWKAPDCNGKIPEPKEDATAVVYKSKMYVFGGDCHGDGDDELHEYDIHTNTWKFIATTGDSPGCRSSHSAVVHSSYMYVFGGL